MPICFDNTRKTLTLTTQNTMYQMQIGPVGHLLHLYYGPCAEGCFDYLQLPRDCGFSPNPYDLQEGRSWSLDLQAQEYSSAGTGDFRLPALAVETETGITGTDLRYVSHEIRSGKYELCGLPSAFDRDGDAQTLSVILADAASGVQAELLYGVFPAQDVITRAVRIRNTGSAVVRLNKAASLCLDLSFGNWQLLHFHGRHTMERLAARIDLTCGIHTVSSVRGTSSHQHNPFVILCEPSATEDRGECYGAMLVYSGSHRTDIEVDQADATRVVMGIQDSGFSWVLKPAETFDAPEAILTYTDRGLGELSRIYHRFIQYNVCRSRYALERRPVLLNSWEAVYMDFTDEKLLQIAREAKDLGVELFVIDDGWFGQRNDDLRGLGDWFVNRTKFPGGLKALTGKLRDMGLKTGLWVEPEMISEDSDLYRSHPDWALTVPGRKPTMGRSQLVLDMTRQDVVDWLYTTLSRIIRENEIDYIKWDMNRHLTDLYSHVLPANRQGEIAHRYVLGLYDLLERLTREFPDVLFEGCSGGGGRFDAGMLAYHPQIWCSDNTDPIARLKIQEGTSFGYPVPTMGSHVSASPNHQTGRQTPLGTRAVVAMAGTFGYELDPGRLNAEEKEQIRSQIRQYHRFQDLIREGDYYRLRSSGSGFAAWQQVSRDKTEVLLSCVLTEVMANPKPLHLKLKGLDSGSRYILRSACIYGCNTTLPENARRIFTGAELMCGGYTLPIMFGDYPSAQLFWEKEEI